MANRLICALGLALTAIPAWVVAQQAPATVPAPASTPVVKVAPPVPVVITAPATPVVPVPPAPPATAAPEPEVNVIIGGAARNAGGVIAPLPKTQFDLPAGTTSAPPASAVAPSSLLPPMPATAPPAKLTPAQIARQIAPNFDVARDYVRLTQCYGMADFMGAVTRIQASRPGATPQIVNVARTIVTLQDAMQPMVLAASTVRGEARFRADYDAIARRGQNELATSRTPNVTMQRRLATLDACRADVIRWRGGR